MSMELIQKLRSQTGAGILDIKKALDESKGNYEKALELLRKRGEAVATKKAGRQASEGIITSYIHMDRIGVLVELNCETDFVARTDDFKNLGKDLAMQIASMNPLYVSSADVPEAVKEKEQEIYRAQIEKENKPEQVKEKIIAGKLQKYYKDACLLHQPYFRDDTQTIQDVVNAAIGKLGENVQIRRFVRFSLEDHETGTKTC